MIPQFKVIWIDSGHQPRVKPDPDFPNGKDIDTGERPACKVKLPYPAPRCGLYIVECAKCGTNAAITAAGRPDDPRSLMLPCKSKPH